MTITTERMLREYNRLDKELNDIYHDIALKIGVSDSAFIIFYLICDIGDGCLQRDICQEAFVNKQTIHSSIRKLEQEGYLFLEQGQGRDKHIHLTESGKEFAQKFIFPIIQLEKDAFDGLSQKEQSELLRLCTKYVKGLKDRVRQL